MDIYLDRTTLVKSCCYCRQAARSLHRGHADSWDGLRAYYDAARSRAVAELIEELSAMLPASMRNQPPPDRSAIGQRLPKLGLLEYLFGAWLSRRKTRWKVPSLEIHYIATRLSAFLQVLERTSKPDADLLIGLRMDLTSCEFILERRGYGLPEIQRAVPVEHFDQTETVPSVSIAEILHEAPQQPVKPASRVAG